jgi:DNA polymerase III gamma/tau subunit
LRLIAKLSSGALRDAIKYMEQVSMLGAITADQVTKFLGVTTESVLQDTMECLQTGDFRHMSELLDTLYTGGTDMIVFAKDLLLWLDEHFMENPESYSTLAGVMREIYRDIKTYPYPVLVFKSKLRHRFAERDGISPVVIPSSAKK